MVESRGSLIEIIEKHFVKIEKILALSVLFILIFSVLTKLILRNIPFFNFSSYLSEWISIMTPHAVLVLGIIGASMGITGNQVIKIEFFNLKSNIIIFIKKVVLASIGIIVLGLYITSSLYSIEFGDKWLIGLIYIPLFSIMLVKFIMALIYEILYSSKK